MNTRQAPSDPSNIYDMLDNLVAKQIGRLSKDFRFMLYAHLSARVAQGLMRIPGGLGAEFPEFYEADREG